MLRLIDEERSRDGDTTVLPGPVKVLSEDDRDGFADTDGTRDVRPGDPTEFPETTGARLDVAGRSPTR